MQQKHPAELEAEQLPGGSIWIAPRSMAEAERRYNDSGTTIVDVEQQLQQRSWPAASCEMSRGQWEDWRSRALGALKRARAERVRLKHWLSTDPYAIAQRNDVSAARAKTKQWRLVAKQRGDVLYRLLAHVEAGALPPADLIQEAHGALHHDADAEEDADTSQPDAPVGDLTLPGATRPGVLPVSERRMTLTEKVLANPWGRALPEPRTVAEAQAELSRLRTQLPVLWADMHATEGVTSSGPARDVRGNAVPLEEMDEWRRRLVHAWNIKVAQCLALQRWIEVRTGEPAPTTADELLSGLLAALTDIAHGQRPTDEGRTLIARAKRHVAEYQRLLTSPAS